MLTSEQNMLQEQQISCGTITFPQWINFQIKTFIQAWILNPNFQSFWGHCVLSIPTLFCPLAVKRPHVTLSFTSDFSRMESNEWKYRNDATAENEVTWSIIRKGLNSCLCMNSLICITWNVFDVPWKRMSVVVMHFFPSSSACNLPNYSLNFWLGLRVSQPPPVHSAPEEWPLSTAAPDAAGESLRGPGLSLRLGVWAP